MATKKIYPFIQARMAEDNETIEDHAITFDAREVAYYHHYEVFKSDDDIVTVGFKSGKEFDLYLGLDQDLYPCDNLITAIDMVQYSEFWHDNDGSTTAEE